MNPSKKRQILSMKRSGFTYAAIAKDTGVTVSHVRAVVADSKPMQGPRKPLTKQPRTKRHDPELYAACVLAKEGHPLEIIFKSFRFNDVGRGIVEAVALKAVDSMRSAAKG